MRSVKRALRRYRQHEGLAVHLAVQFARRHTDLNLQELIQTARIALFRAALTAKHEKTFPKYAIVAIKWTLEQSRHRPFYVRNEIQLDDVIRTDEDDVLTRGDVIEKNIALHDRVELIAAERQMSLEADVWHAIHNGANLTPVERLVLQMRFFEDHEINDVVAALKKLPYERFQEPYAWTDRYSGKKIIIRRRPKRPSNYEALAGALTSRGIWKLRRYFAKKGFAVDLTPLKRLTLSEKAGR